MGEDNCSLGIEALNASSLRFPVLDFREFVLLQFLKLSFEDTF